MPDLIFPVIAFICLIGAAVAGVLLRKSKEHRRRLLNSNAALDVRLSIVERNMPTALVVFDAKGLIRHANPAAERLLGYTLAELYGQNLLRIMPGSPEAVHGDCTIRHKDGTLLPVHFRVDRSETAAREIYIFFDEPKPEAEVPAPPVIVQQARPSLTLVDGVVNRIVREFEGLLTQINGYTELAMHGAPPDSPILTDLKELAAASDTASNLARNLLAFSGNQTIPTQVLDLNVVLMAMESALRETCRGPFRIEIAPQRAAVMGNADCLRQIVLLLAKSGLQRVAPEGCVQIASKRVSLSEPKPVYTGRVPAGEYAVLSVSDDGAALRPYTLEHLFEPLFLDADAVGVELSPVYGLVRSVGGWIDVVSSDDIGTVCNVYFPYAGDVQVGSSAQGSRALAG
ncbi:MAG: PAS domain S-box protein [Bryobacteraceae bacterium]